MSYLDLLALTAMGVMGASMPAAEFGRVGEFRASEAGFFHTLAAHGYWPNSKGE